LPHPRRAIQQEFVAFGFSPQQNLTLSTSRKNIPTLLIV
jgi:hypothetical protein